MASATIVLANDLELPGLPTRNIGILSSIHTIIMNTFSFKAWFFAIFGAKSTFSKKTDWHLQYSLKKTKSVSMITQLHFCIKPPLLQRKSVLIRGIASLKRENEVVFYYLSTSEI
jgi:hypothetical protein